MAGPISGAALEVGARVVIGKDRDKATVRYLGPVEGQQGSWVGVEWDDASRGKHDGSTGGRRYFSVTSGPTAGSFIRAEKVHAGVPLLTALRARYNNEAAEGSAAGAGRAVYLDTKSSRRVLVELVGEEQVTERQRRTELLTRARVVDACVSAVVSARRRPVWKRARAGEPCKSGLLAAPCCSLPEYTTSGPSKRRQEHEQWVAPPCCVAVVWHGARLSTGSPTPARRTQPRSCAPRCHSWRSWT
jgi:hypothetical protein